MHVKYFDSDEELFAYLEQQRKEGERLAAEHPVKVDDLKHGEVFFSVRPDFGVVVFGEVMEYSEKYPEDNEAIASSRSRGFVFARCYSALCVDGEFGNTHITRINGKVSKEVFERAKANGFRHLQASN